MAEIAILICVMLACVVAGVVIVSMFFDAVVWAIRRVGFVRVIKHAAYVPVSCCILTDATGVNHCDHPEWTPPKVRFTMRVRMLVWKIRHRVGDWINGGGCPDD